MGGRYRARRLRSGGGGEEEKASGRSESSRRSGDEAGRQKQQQIGDGGMQRWQEIDESATGLWLSVNRTAVSEQATHQRRKPSSEQHFNYVNRSSWEYVRAFAHRKRRKFENVRFQWKLIGN